MKIKHMPWKNKKGAVWILSLCMLISLVFPVSAAETVTLLGVENGMTLEKNQPLKLYAEAANPSGAVEFYADSDLLGKGEAENGGLYSLTWTPSKAGSYKLSVKAGNVLSEPVLVYVKNTLTMTEWDFQNYYENNTITGSKTLTLRKFDIGYGNFVYRANNSGNSGSIKRTNKAGTSGAAGPRWLQANINPDSGANPYVDVLFPDEDLSVYGNGMIEIGMKLKFGGDWVNGKTVFSLRDKNDAAEQMAVLSSGKAKIDNDGTKTEVSYLADTEEWYTINMVYDPYNKSKALYFDGIYAGRTSLEATDELTAPAGFRIDMITEGDDGVVYGGTFMIDDFYVRQFIDEPPSISLGKLESGIKIEQDSAFVLTAEMENVSEKAERVEFYADNTILGSGTETTENNYELAWTPAEAGIYTVKAVAVVGGKEISSEEKELCVKPAIIRNKYDFESWTSSVTTSGTIDTVDGYVYRGNMNNNGGSISSLRTGGEYGTAADMHIMAATGNPYLHIDIPAANRYPAKEGTVSVEYDVYFTGNADKISLTGLARTEKGGYDYGIVFQDGKVCYKAASGNVPTGRTYRNNQWYHVKTVYDFESGKKDIYFDGKLIAPRLALSNNAAYDAFRLEAGARGSDGEMYSGNIYFDNFTIKIITDPLELEGLVFKAADGEVIEAASPAADMLKTVELCFTKEAAADTVTRDSVKLYRGSDIMYLSDSELSVSGKTIGLTFKEPIDRSAVYTVIIEQTVTSADGAPLKKRYRQSFMTASGGSGIENAGFYCAANKLEDLSGLTDGSVITYKAEAVSDTDDTVYVVITRYNNGSVKGFAVNEAELTAGVKQEISVTMPIEEEFDNGDILSGYVWRKSTLGSMGDAFSLQR